MKWTSPDDLKTQALRHWNSGAALASLITGETIYPLRLTLKRPTSAEIASRFEAVRQWNSSLRAQPHLRVEMREFNHRVFGSNALADCVWLDSIEDAAALAGRLADIKKFKSLIAVTQKHPMLLPYLAKHPHAVLVLAAQWSQLLDISTWIIANPRSNIYARQVNVAGVDSKFIESYQREIAGLVAVINTKKQAEYALLSSVSSISDNAKNMRNFMQKHGFKEKPLRIRFRILDASHALFTSEGSQDITLDAHTFASLTLQISRVFITENEINFLAFPDIKDSLIIFGAGYGFDALANIQWLNNCKIHYWGDIDTHGFAILDQLRNHFSQVKSLLMDEATLLAHQLQWGSETTPTTRDLARLNAPEALLHNDLRDNRLGKNVRLEQERISFGVLNLALEKLN